MGSTGESGISVVEESKDNLLPCFVSRRVEGSRNEDGVGPLPVPKEKLLTQGKGAEEELEGHSLGGSLGVRVREYSDKYRSGKNS